MNLDDFKIRINQELETNTSFELPVAEIKNLSKPNTFSVLQKIKKSLQFEICFGVIVFFGFMILASATHLKSIRYYFGFFAIVIFLFTCLLMFLYTKTNNVSIVKLSIKQHLSQLHNLLSVFVKRCFQFTMLLIPICFASTIYLAYNDIQYHNNNFNANYDVPFPKKYIIILSVLVIAFSIFVYYFTKWYLQKMYGKHLLELKQMLTNFEE